MPYTLCNPIFAWLPVLCIIAAFLCILNEAKATAVNNSPVLYTYDVVNRYPHDPAAFTQGLVYSDGRLFESTGLWGQSSLREVELETGMVTREVKLDDRYFGEGLELIGDRLYQLTWKAGLVFVYDSNSLQRLKTHKIAGQGWGLTAIDDKLVKSDGSSRLTFMNPETLATTQIMEITDGTESIEKLNELELVNDTIYANIYRTSRIVMISPVTGAVVGTLDLSSLLKTANYHGKAGVLNGIAYDSEEDRLFVTGKNWPWLFEIKIRKKYQ